MAFNPSLKKKKNKKQYFPTFHASGNADEFHVEVIVWDFQESCSQQIHSCGKYARFDFSHFAFHMCNTDVMAGSYSIHFVPMRERAHTRELQRLACLGTPMYLRPCNGVFRAAAELELLVPHTSDSYLQDEDNRAYLVGSVQGFSDSTGKLLPMTGSCCLCV